MYSKSGPPAGSRINLPRNSGCDFLWFAANLLSMSCIVIDPGVVQELQI